MLLILVVFIVLYLTIYNTLREGKDMYEYPIPFIEEVDNFNTIEFGTLR